MVMAMIEDITRLPKWARNRLDLVLGAGGHPVSVVARAGVLALAGCVSTRR